MDVEPSSVSAPATSASGSIEVNVSSNPVPMSDSTVPALSSSSSSIPPQASSFSSFSTINSASASSLEVTYSSSSSSMSSFSAAAPAIAQANFSDSTVSVSVPVADDDFDGPDDNDEAEGGGDIEGFRSRQRRSHKQILEDDEDGLKANKNKKPLLDFSNGGPAVSATFTFSTLIDKQQEDVLRKYYGRLFPCSAMYRWLSYNDGDFGARREWSFTLSGDIYVRYLAFTSKEQLKADLVRRAPIKIDIGAVYNASPTLKLQVAKFAPVAREFVIDIDMSDYNDIRRCCSESQVCDRCWPLMTAAIKVLDSILTEEFGFEHVMWVYSGRRGVHGWICDARARMLSNELRGALIDYLSLYIHGNEQNKHGRIVNLAYPLHPRIQRVVSILKPYFEVLLRTEGWFSSKKDARHLLQFLDVNYQKEFNWKFDDELRAPASGEDDGVDPMSVEGAQVWGEFVERLGHLAFKYNKPGRQADTRAVRLTEFRVLLSHTYPRLDVNVSKQLNHLLKAPFCVHPKTGKICVPIDVKNAENFRPDAVPTVEELLAQLDNLGAVPRAWQRTTLRSHLEYFNAFIKRVTHDQRDKMAKEEDAKQEEKDRKSERQDDEKQQEQQTGW